jgi:hypothetical protein
MTVEEMVQEAAKGLDGLIPPVPNNIPLPNIINISIPETKIKFEYAKLDWTPLDSIASVSMCTGLIVLGYLIRIILG